ncbi:iron-sulfur cluster biosynthesis family protein [Bacillus sp. ISL-34]|uniref:iron-sulfur cluster biosynthesis family protein n=1 Tax=Bacillus sp. ISL-34 TaxID=2819121 RepID=UPI002852E352|nr:iron-sulfur cluster biosynthesis family protein [Bacillus sp. ISL-34]
MMGGRAVPKGQPFILKNGIVMKGRGVRESAFVRVNEEVIFMWADLAKGSSFFNRSVFIVYNGERKDIGRRAIMYIEWTETAAEKMAGKVQGQEGYLQLKYDTDGCGCVVSGVTALWWVNEPEEGTEKVETNGIPLYVEKSKMIFLDEVMKIDFVPEANSFQLKSPNQILNPRMSYFNKI